MTVGEMHYDFKKKLNKVDSQQYKNFLIPEIDWVLNEAQDLFIKMITKPRLRSYLGFEKNQRCIDDIRNIVIKDMKILDLVTDPTTGVLKGTRNVFPLPKDYMFYVKSDVKISKPDKGNKNVVLTLRQNDDKFNDSPFDNFSFDWGVVNGNFYKDGIMVYTDDNTKSELSLTYIKKAKMISYAKNYVYGTAPTDIGYKLPGSTVKITDNSDCELAFQTHSEIVDLAVLITTGEINLPDYQLKVNKLALNSLK